MPSTPDETARGRPGMVPVPPESPLSPRRSHIPDESMRPPSRPKEVGAAKSKGPPKPQKLWTFRYEGDSGGELEIVPFTPMDLATPELVTVQFYQDTNIRGTSRTVVVPPDVVGLANASYDPIQTLAAPAPGEFKIVPTGPTTFAILIGTSADPVAMGPTAHGGDVLVPQVPAAPPGHETPTYTHYGPVDTHPHLAQAQRLFLWGSTEYLPEEGYGTRLKLTYTIFNVDTSNPASVRFNCELFSSSNTVLGPPTQDPVAMDLFGIYLLIPRDPVEIYPNAAMRALLRYSIGTSDDIPIECDWRGKVQVMATRIALERKAVRADMDAPYEPHRVVMSGVAMVGGSPSAVLPTLTEPAALVPAESSRTLDIPPLAVRMTLLMRWGLEESDPPDAPLGQVFVAFVSEAGNALGLLDAMGAREALFGAGVPIPAGAVEVVLSNRVEPDAALKLGVIWHLGV